MLGLPDLCQAAVNTRRGKDQGMDVREGGAGEVREGKEREKIDRQIQQENTQAE